MNCEKNVPFKARLGEYLKRQAERVRAAGVDVKLGTPVTEAVALGIAPDVIIAALGARPVKPGIPGIDGTNVRYAEDVYLNPDLAGKRVLILGGGLVGTELGIFYPAWDVA